MKKIICTLVMLSISIMSLAQITVGTSQIGPFKDFDKGEYEVIKGKKTVFVVDHFDIDAFTNMVKEVWTYNDFEVISRKAYDEKNYQTEKYAPFIVEGIVSTSTSSRGMTTERLYIYHHYFYYKIKQKKKKNKIRKRTIAGVYLSGEPETLNETVYSKTFGNLDQGFYNFGLGYLKNYLQKINKELTEEGFSWAYASDEDKKKLKALKKNTLYVPDFMKTKYQAWAIAGAGERDVKNPDDLFKKYDHDYQWISKAELNDKILTANEDFYYLMYVRVNSQKMISVVNGKTGEIIYRDYETMSYNIKSNDIKRLNSKIK